MQQNQTAIACTLSPDEQQRCMEGYRSGLFSHVEEVRERQDGYSLRFPWQSERVRQLGEFLAVESACCSFLSHSVEIPGGRHSIWLHLTGPEEARAVLQGELQALLPSHLRSERIAPQTDDASVIQGNWRTRYTRAGLSGLGVGAVLCCLAPLIGLSTLAIASGWLLDVTLGVLLTFGLGAVVVNYLRRRNQDGSKCC